MLTASSDGTARAFEMERGQCLRVLAGHTAAVHALAMDPWARFIVTASADGTARVWDLSSARSIHVLRTGCSEEQGARRLAGRGPPPLLLLLAWAAAVLGTAAGWLLLPQPATLARATLTRPPAPCPASQAARCAWRCRPARALPSWAWPTAPLACMTSSAVRVPLAD